MYKCTDCIQNIVPKFTRDYVNICATDGKFIVDISCSSVNDTLKI